MRQIPVTKRIGLALPMIVALAAVACVSKSDNKAPSGPPVAAGSTGAFGIVTVNGRQKMYLPIQAPDATSGHGTIAVVDVGLAGNGANGAPALITTIDLGTTDVATSSGGDSSVVVAASISSHDVWFIDPQTDTLVATTSLDASFGASGFSGGGGVVTGVAIDSANHRAILSTWNGFTLVDTQTHAVTSTIQAPPSENFGYDSVHQRIIAPFYDCSTSTNTAGPLPLCANYKDSTGQPQSDGLNVIDLNDGTVYTFVDPKALTPDQPVGSEPDSAAIDPTNQIAVVPSEGGDYQNVLDLSQAAFDKNAKTFTAPNHLIQNQGLTGVAIEPNAHLGFWEEEHSADVGLANVVDANGGGQTYVHALMPNVPGGNTWSNMGDPHGIAVTTGIADGHAVGFVVSSDQHWVARVDLQKMSDLGTAAGATVQPDITPAVTYLDATTAIPATK